MRNTNTNIDPHAKGHSLSYGGKNIAHFLDDWPLPPRHNQSNENDPDLSEVKKWRLQTLLAVNPWGIPSLAFADAYKRMFGKPLDVAELGFGHLSEMVNKMPDIFAVQEPDDSTRILFPDYARDRILHDARLGHDFARPNLDLELPLPPSRSCQSICTSVSNDSLATQTTGPQSVTGTKRGDADHMNELIYRAWMDRDEDFPPDVVLAGEPYDELLIISSANLPGTRGLYQATLLSAATPDSFYVQLKTNEQDTKRILKLPNDIAKYFQETKHPMEAYSVPREFLYPGFPCLLYMDKDSRSSWERCVIAAKSRSSGKVLVEAVDFGGWYAVDPLYLYLIPRRFLEVPRQTFQLSLAGVRPPADAKDARWPAKVGPRMRCFSYRDYWLDLLLMDAKEREVAREKIEIGAEKKENNSTLEDSASNKDGPSRANDSNDSPNQIGDTTCGSPKKTQEGRLRFRAKPRYDAIVVDRNDHDLDIYLDEILVLETYAKVDESRKDELDAIKSRLREVLKTIPRPSNPFYQQIEDKLEP